MQCPSLEQVKALVAQNKAFYGVTKGQLTLYGYRFAHGQTFATMPWTREVRGIIYAKDGQCVSRPFHKFFNLGEPLAPQDFGADLWVAEKIDGYMVQAFLYRNKVTFASRKGFSIPLVSKVLSVLGQEDKKRIRDLLVAFAPATVLIEVYSNQYPVMVRYASSGYRILAVRQIDTGQYILPGKDLHLPNSVQWVPLTVHPSELHAQVKHYTGIEGYVVWTGIDFVKVKTAWAFKLAHFLMAPGETFAQAILNDTIDDLYGVLASRPDLRARLQYAHNEFARAVNWVYATAERIKGLPHKDGWTIASKPPFDHLASALAKAVMDQAYEGIDAMQSLRKSLAKGNALAKWADEVLAITQVLQE